MRIAKGTQTTGQTKEQSKLIAKGIEKGIALYKKQEKEKTRERAKLRKRRDKQQTGEANGAMDTTPSSNDVRSAAKHPATAPLAVAGTVFSVVSAAHLLRYFFGLDLIVGMFVVPVTWSLPAAAVSALLAVWMFWSMRGRAAGRE